MTTAPANIINKQSAERASSLQPSVMNVHAADGDGKFHFPVTEDFCVGPPGNVFLFGGAGLSSAVAAMEQHSGRPLICATAQYISYAREGDLLEIATQFAANGKQISQMQATLKNGDHAIIMVTATLGNRDGWTEHQWTQMPDVLPPEQCKEWPIWPIQAGGLLERIEVRLEPSEIARLTRDGKLQPHGRLRYWMRPNYAVRMDAAFLALAADFVPAGAAAAFGLIGGGNSMDNVLRIGRIVPTEWLMCEVEIDMVQRGFAHGNIRIFAQSGELMATGSQSLALRFHPQ